MIFQHEGAGAQSGSITFLPKGSVMTGERGGIVSGEHYERIRDVLDRLEEGRSQTEAAIANLYHSLQQKQSNNQELSSTTSGGDPKSPNYHGTSPLRPTLLSPKVDLSWKEGGRNFPRKQPQVGDDYQVAELPKAGTFESGKHDEYVFLLAF
jgi:hypothetical protein